MYLSWLTSFGKATLSTPPPCWVTLSRARATSCSRVKPDLATPTTGQGNVPRLTMFWSAGNIFLKAKSPVAPKKTSASERGTEASGFRGAWLGLDIGRSRASPSGTPPSTTDWAPNPQGGRSAAHHRQYRAQHHGPVKAGNQCARLESMPQPGEARRPRDGSYTKKAGQPCHGIVYA